MNRGSAWGAVEAIFDRAGFVINPSDNESDLVSMLEATEEAAQYMPGLVRELLNDPQRMAATAARSMEYGTGFRKIVLPMGPVDDPSYLLRLHMWTLAQGELAADSNAHDHRMPFAAKLLAGGYRHRIYQAIGKGELDPADLDYGTLLRYGYVPPKDGEPGQAREVVVGEAALRCVTVQDLPEGTAYAFAEGDAILLNGLPVAHHAFHHITAYDKGATGGSMPGLVASLVAQNLARNTETAYRVRPSEIQEDLVEQITPMSVETLREELLRLDAHYQTQDAARGTHLVGQAVAAAHRTRLAPSGRRVTRTQGTRGGRLARHEVTVAMTRESKVGGGKG